MKTSNIKERPILFSGPMVRAILDGRKTMTRRIVKPQPIIARDKFPTNSDDMMSDGFSRKLVLKIQESPGIYRCLGIQNFIDEFCPYGKVGDRLWVRESWRPKIIHSCTDTCDCEDFKITYSSDGQEEFFPSYDKRVDPNWCIPEAAKKGDVPSIFMPRWASRITLEITDIKMERLQEMSYYDWCADFCFDMMDRERALASGCGKQFQDEYSKKLWDSINAKRGYSWESNPFVWVVSFKRVGE